MRNKIHWCFLLLLIVFKAFAIVEVDVSPGQISLDEIFQLTFTLKDVQVETAPNLASLQHDFYVMSTEHSMSYVVNQGVAHTVSQWTLNLRPKRIGSLTIPAITVGQQQSKPTVVKVTAHASAGSNIKTLNIQNSSYNPLVLRVSTNSVKPYINQEVIYTVTLLNRERLLRADYRPPHADDALIVTYGTSRHYQTEISGELYEAEEQKYAIFPQKSGALTIHPPSLNGMVYDFTPRPVNVTANKIVLHVQPAKFVDAKHPWLPTTELKISEDVGKTTLHEGDTLVRTITLEARELPAELLPALPIVNTNNYRVYAAKPELQNSVNNQALLGRSIQKITYVMAKSGEITWPAIDLEWFNPKTQQTMHARLPAHTFTVLPKVSSGLSLIPKKSKHVAVRAPHKKNVASLQAKRSIPEQFFAKGSHCISSLLSQIRNKNQPISLSKCHWVMGCGASLIIVLLFGVIYWFCKNKRFKKIQLKKCSFTKDPSTARDAVLIWARRMWPDARILNLSDVIALVDDVNLQQHLRYLAEVLYAPSARGLAWSGLELWQKLSKYTSCTKKRNQQQTLDPLL